MRDFGSKRIARERQGEGSQRARGQLSKSPERAAQTTGGCLLRQQAFRRPARSVHVRGLTGRGVKFERAEQKMRAAPIRFPCRRISPETKRCFKIRVGSASLIEQTGKPRPIAANQSRVPFARFDERVDGRVLLCVRVLVL